MNQLLIQTLFLMLSNRIEKRLAQFFFHATKKVQKNKDPERCYLPYHLKIYPTSTTLIFSRQNLQKICFLRQIELFVICSNVFFCFELI